MMNQYICATCQEPVQLAGEGLKTATCRKHPFRMVTVSRDTSGGSEQLRDRRRQPVSVKRHTLIRVVKVK